MKKAKRILILTGAGAAYPWFANEVKVTTTTITDEKEEGTVIAVEDASLES